MLPLLVAVAVALAIPLAVFLPLILAGIEGAVFGTSQVEEFFRQIGLHDELDAIYDPVIEFLRSLFA